MDDVVARGAERDEAIDRSLQARCRRCRFTGHHRWQVEGRTRRW